MKKNPKLNVLRRIQKHILAEPRRFQMHKLAVFETPGTVIDIGRGREQRIPDCGTTQCIAGWANTLSGENPIGLLALPRAADIIGLAGFSDDVFYDIWWPEPFRTRYQRCVTPFGRAKAAADRIEHLIKTGE